MDIYYSLKCQKQLLIWSQTTPLPFIHTPPLTSLYFPISFVYAPPLIKFIYASHFLRMCLPSFRSIYAFPYLLLCPLSLYIRSFPLTPYTPSNDTVCPRSSYPIYVETYYLKWVITSWTDGIICRLILFQCAFF